MADPASTPIKTRRERVMGFDVARCVAILTMVYVNFDVVLSMGRTKPELLRSLGEAFTGRASATFVTLAGIGFVLLGDRVLLLKRALFLLIIGYAWQLFCVGDILHYYAFYLLFGALCLGLRARWLWLLAALCPAVFAICVRGVSIAGFELAPIVDYGAGWNWLALDYTEFWTMKGQARNLLFNGWHPLFPWLAFIFCGMALGEWGLAEATKRRIALAVSAAAFTAAHFISQALTSAEGASGSGWDALEQWYLQPKSFWALDSLPPGPLYILSAGASAVFVIALCLELTSDSAGKKGALAKALAECGQLAFTIYVAHILFLYLLLDPVMEHLIDERVLTRRSTLYFSATGTLIFDMGAILAATLWRSAHRRGPLEAVMRKLTG